MICHRGRSGRTLEEAKRRRHLPRWTWGSPRVQPETWACRSNVLPLAKMKLCTWTHLICACWVDSSCIYTGNPHPPLQRTGGPFSSFSPPVRSRILPLKTSVSCDRHRSLCWRWKASFIISLPRLLSGHISTLFFFADDEGVPMPVEAVRHAWAFLPSLFAPFESFGCLTHHRGSMLPRHVA